MHFSVISLKKNGKFLSIYSIFYIIYKIYLKIKLIHQIYTILFCLWIACSQKLVRNSLSD